MMYLDTSHLETVPPRKQGCNQVWFSPERNGVQQRAAEKSSPYLLEMVFSQRERSRKRARKPSPVRTTLLSQSGTMQARTEQAFINIF